ncbi:hypothetical protein LOK49_LG09G00170 [Camellia lanceoleosa]|uniref:Uncharacterized protein n=2 Tax=Camellia lanceoleosa TaxID=1840588 RepID=A0ACC0GNE1_9ERIC|nr:hypothetical protein LOK49_LG09G00185 [Camellia lanceoleosa]KAI8001978.1 hypothetical protein LOK49_LG09G00170 [Camellia lanceoleosa]
MAKKMVMGCSMWVLALILSPTNATSCKQFIHKLRPCKPFLVGKGSSVTATSACCKGARDLNRMISSSVSDSKGLVTCLTNAAKSMKFKSGQAMQLQKLCNIKNPSPSIFAYLDAIE